MAKKQASDNKRRRGRDHITKDVLLGKGNYDSAQGQLYLEKEALIQATAYAVNAWRALPITTEKTTTLGEVKQRADEIYEDSVSRLILAVRRVITNEEAANILIKQLAFENANFTCQALLWEIRKTGSLIDYIFNSVLCHSSFRPGGGNSSSLKRRNLYPVYAGVIR